LKKRNPWEEGNVDIRLTPPIQPQTGGGEKIKYHPEGATKILNNGED